MSQVSLVLVLWPLLPVLATLVPGQEVQFKSKAGFRFSGTDNDKVSWPLITPSIHVMFGRK